MYSLKVETGKTKLGYGVIIILFANVLNLIFSVLTNFLLPKYLSVDSYSAIKTYQLYMTYAGLFALGFSDGIYLKYGGKQLNSVSIEEQKTNLASIRLLLLVEIIIVTGLSVFINDKILFAYALSIMPFNMMGYFKNLYQAVGLFKKYSRIINITTFLTFAVNIVFLIIFKTDDYFYLLIGYVIVNVGIWLLLEVISVMSIGNTFKLSLFSISSTTDNIKDGFLLMVGNLSSLLFTGMDRWFVKFLLTTYDFALYSFAVSLEGFLNVAITPLTITLYNFFCTNRETETVNKLRRVMYIFSSVIISLAFILRFIIEKFLPGYTDSLNVMFLLFAAQLFFVPNKAIYVNLYKASGQQNRYFLKLLAVLAVGLLTNIAFYFVGNQKESFAYATLVSSLVWMVLSVHDFKNYRLSINEIGYCFTEILIFIIASKINIYLGLIIYVVGSIILMLAIMRDEVIYLVGFIISLLKYKV